MCYDRHVGRGPCWTRFIHTRLAAALGQPPSGQPGPPPEVGSSALSTARKEAHAVPAPACATPTSADAEAMGRVVRLRPGVPDKRALADPSRHQLRPREVYDGARRRRRWLASPPLLRGALPAASRRGLGARPPARASRAAAGQASRIRGGPRPVAGDSTSGRQRPCPPFGRRAARAAAPAH